MMTDEHHPNNFDFIRFAAALSVVFSHGYDLSGRDGLEPLRALTSYSFSYFGVRFFFIISGFLITQSLFRNPDMFRFFGRRSRRIFPGLIVAVLACMFVLGAVTTSLPIGDFFRDAGTWSYLSNILLYRSQPFLPGVFETSEARLVVNGSLWTLVYEFTCYVGLFLLHRLTLLRKRNRILCLFLAGLAIDTLLTNTPFFGYYYPSINMFPGFFSEFSLFFGGGVLLFLYREELLANRQILPVVAAIAFAGVLLIPDYGRLMMFFALPPVIFFLAFLKGKLNRFGKTGDYSYGIYIYSFPIQQWVLYSFPFLTVSGVLLLSVAIVFPLAYLSWNYVEFPMMRRQQTPRLAL